jgi:hypothetical protein
MDILAFSIIIFLNQSSVRALDIFEKLAGMAMPEATMSFLAI